MDLNGKVILLTGGTGSFGRKFVEMVLSRHRPKKLIVFSRDELKQHEMRQVFPESTGIRYFIGDVRDLDRLQRAMNGVDIVVHAAALKQVEACEYNPMEAILTNIIGAKNVIDAAIDQNVKKVMALSTDKAVGPINLYGATKLCAEKLFVQSNAYSSKDGAQFSCVRYGNVIGSRGSVVPLFRAQRKTGCVTVTDKRMTRFWLPLSQAVQFVIRNIVHMHGGEVFIPKIPSMKIMDLVEAIAPECRVKEIGIRAGEKLHEALISEDEARHTIEMDDMYIVQPAHQWWNRGNWKEGRALPEGFTYASNANTDWLSLVDLRQIAKDAT